MTKTIEIELPVDDISFLEDLALVRGWKAIVHSKRRPTIDEGIEDIAKGNVFRAKDVEEMKKQIFG